MSKRPDGVLFRCASEARVGGGHVSRCLAVAAALDQALPTLMVLDSGAKAAAGRCAKAGIAAVEGPVDIGRGWGVCVLDGYEFTPDDYAFYASLAPLVVFDDLSQPAAEASLIINPTPGLSGDQWDDRPALLGARFAPIRPQFAALAERVAPPIVERVLITLGSTPAYQAAEHVLRAIAAARGGTFDPEVTLVLRDSPEKPDSLRRIMDQFSRRLIHVESVSDMVPMLNKMDFVIGAGGVSLLERMAAGVPSVSVVLAENQRAAIHGAAALGATIAHEFDDEISSVDRLADVVRRAAADPDLRTQLARAGRQAVDGKGAARIAEALIRLSRSEAGRLN